MNLFDIELPKYFMDEFKITLNHSLYISDNIFAAKEQGKRVLLEMVDTHSKLILGYSGGMDSSFILCCIRDLIDEGKITEDTIEIVQGIFTGNDVILTLDHKRATKFANSLGFNPRIHKFDIHENWKECENLIRKYKLSGRSTVTGSYQILFAMQQDGTVITTTTRLPLNMYPHLPKLSDHSFTLLWMASAIDNQINFQTWDRDNYSSYITPFKLNMGTVNTQPYNMKYCGDHSYHINYQSINSLQKFLHVWMIYLQCYPKMFEIFGKFVTIDWVVWEQHCSHDDITRLKNFDDMPVNVTGIKLANGELFTEKHLLNYDEMKEGEK
jgi:hypothetical protein